ncbi:MAG: NAD-dependent epimerase/dehydratase family protein [Bacilli bacterium]|nr:NAD-dependent epimerase/dehydratase family protein [Bacilli bacterium]
MKLLITGAKGFMGRHVAIHAQRHGHDVFGFDLDSSDDDLKSYVQQADAIIHLAGVNRPSETREFYVSNVLLTQHLIELVQTCHPTIPVIFASSIQADLDNDYGKSKKQAEALLRTRLGNAYIYRLTNTFGKWCRPNYNSVCATFCHNIAKGLPISIRDENYVVHFNYVEDVAEDFLRVLEGGAPQIGEDGFFHVDPIYGCSLGHLAELLSYFKGEVESPRHLPLLHDEFELKLFKTFCDYLSEPGYSYNYAADGRGSFEEFYKSNKWGQISENIAFPGITKGGHYHSYKKEIFYTVLGECLITQRNPKTGELIKNHVCGRKPELIDIRVGFTHEITNVGQSDSHTVMWISEPYNPDSPDTYKDD